jgi:hypothetical protein
MPCVNSHHKPKIGTIWPTFSVPGVSKNCNFFYFCPCPKCCELEYWNRLQETSWNQIWWYQTFFAWYNLMELQKFHEFKISHLFDCVNEKSSSRWSWTPVGALVFFFSFKTIFHYFFQYTFSFIVFHIIFWFNPFSGLFLLKFRIIKLFPT